MQSSQPWPVALQLKVCGRELAKTKITMNCSWQMICELNSASGLIPGLRGSVITNLVFSIGSVKMLKFSVMNPPFGSVQGLLL